MVDVDDVPGSEGGGYLSLWDLVARVFMFLYFCVFVVLWFCDLCFYVFLFFYFSVFLCFLC